MKIPTLVFGMVIATSVLVTASQVASAEDQKASNSGPVWTSLQNKPYELTCEKAVGGRYYWPGSRTVTFTKQTKHSPGNVQDPFNSPHSNIEVVDIANIGAVSLNFYVHNGNIDTLVFDRNNGDLYSSGFSNGKCSSKMIDFAEKFDFADGPTLAQFVRRDDGDFSYYSLHCTDDEMEESTTLVFYRKIGQFINYETHATLNPQSFAPPLFHADFSSCRP